MSKNACEDRFERQRILYDRDAVGKPEEISFEPSDWAAKGALVGEARGRGHTYFVKTGNGDWVLRHYQRGGMLAGILRDNYLWTGIDHTRAWKEWRMLAQLWQAGLPVPRPVAARVLRHGLMYKADIITQRLLGTHTLAELLSQNVLDARHWELVGTCIRRFHDANIYHADLNAHNLLLSEDDRVYLIDFDRSEVRAESKAWKDKNLARLHRSLTKLRSLRDNFHFSGKDWLTLHNGYDTAG